VVPHDPHSLPALIAEHAAWLTGAGYAATTVRSRQSSLHAFAAWAAERGVTRPDQLTLSVLERYQQTLAAARQGDGRPLSWGAQAHEIGALRRFGQWLARTHRVASNPAQELVLPRRPHRLPRGALSAEEAERVLAQPDVTTPMGLRDRAMLETLYSTGIRRLELIHLELPDVDAGRGVLFIREGKGRKDRVVPIGERALGWLERYRREVRPQLVVPPDPGRLFLTRRGRPLRENRLTELVHRYVQAAGLGKQGSCHLFRHTMATLLLEGGADVREVQEMLGHSHLSTTALYTHVAIGRLKQVHQAAHPAERSSARASSLAASLPAAALPASNHLADPTAVPRP